MLRKLFITYQTAKKDFDASRLRSLERTRSAKFLRDTTENCLAYLTANQNPLRDTEPPDTSSELSGGSAIVDEMNTTLQKAIEAAEEGSGGKKRRFDDDWAFIPAVPAAMRQLTAENQLKSGDPIPRGTYSAHQPGKGSVVHRVAKQQPLQFEHRTRRVPQSERLPRNLYPVSAGKGTRRVFPMPSQDHRGQSTQRSLGHGDFYRPKYRHSV